MGHGSLFVATFNLICGCRSRRTHPFSLGSMAVASVDVELPSWMKRSLESAAAEPKPKGARGSSSQGDIGELLKRTAKLALIDSPGLAEVSAAVYTAYKLPDIPLAPALEAAEQQYEAESKEMNEKKKAGEQVEYAARGPPHLQVWCAMIHHAVQNAQEPTRPSSSTIGTSAS